MQATASTLRSRRHAKGTVPEEPERLFSEAEELLRRGLKILENAYGPAHPEVGTRLNNLARLLFDTERFAEAEPLSRRQMEIFLSVSASSGREHPLLRKALDHHFELLMRVGRSEGESHREM